MDATGSPPCEEEQEALGALYGDAASVQVDGSVAVRLRPQTNGDASREYVGGTLLLRLPAGYPEQQPAAVLLRDVAGLGEARQRELLEHVRAEAGALVGEWALCSVCEAAIAWLSDNNWPDGTPTNIIGFPHSQPAPPIAHCAKFLIEWRMLSVQRTGRPVSVAPLPHAHTQVPQGGLSAQGD